MAGLTYTSGSAVLASFAWTGAAPVSGGATSPPPSGFALADTIAATEAATATSAEGTFTDGSTMTAYASDGAGQLVGSVDTSGNATSYSYDPNGNRIGAGYVVGPDNELLADPTHTYTYDADGRMTSAVDTTTGVTTTYSWDARGRLVGASVYAANGSLEESVSYTYDALNQLVRRVVTGPSGNVLSDERYANEVTSLTAPVVTAGTTSQASLDNLAAVIGADGTVTDRYLYGQGTDQVLAQDSPGSGTQWLLTDNQGTVRAVAATNPATGQTSVVKQITYDAFGNVTSDSNPAVSVRFGYTGRWVDSVTGLQNNRARWYDSGDGRWISQDPMGFNAGQPSLYVYVGNNPTRATDPSGEDRVYVSGNQVIYAHTNGWSIFPSETTNLGVVVKAADGTEGVITRGVWVSVARLNEAAYNYHSKGASRVAQQRFLNNVFFPPIVGAQEVRNANTFNPKAATDGLPPSRKRLPRPTLNGSEAERVAVLESQEPLAIASIAIITLPVTAPLATSAAGYAGTGALATARTGATFARS